MVDGPGPGVLPLMGMAAEARSFATTSTQIRFIGQTGMAIGWQIPDGFAENQLVSPARYNFQQGATYRLKLSMLPDRKGEVLYPTLQVHPTHPSTDGYLAHNSVPIELTDDDLDQVQSNNYVTKVIYLPDPQFQDQAIAGLDTLVSTRLDPGVDPVAEADRRGTILVVFRIGNMSLEAAGAPAPGDENAQIGPDGKLMQVAHRLVDGATGQHEPPMPIATAVGNGFGIPAPMIVAGGGAPGMPPSSPIAGVGPTPPWGMPITGTPIGLPGPPHLPYGGPAGLRSHTVRNLSRNNIPKPVDHMLIDVRHNPGYSVPEPVRHIEYTETHPTFGPGQTAYPKWANP
jgi:hypothetical protein